MKIAVFASGFGSNFQAIAEAVNTRQLAAEIALLFCDKKAAPVIKKAHELMVPVISFSPNDFKSKAMYEAEILHLLEEEQIDLVVLAGYMRIIGATLLEEYANRIINIHPSLLPAFPGLNSIQAAFEAQVNETGVTIHYVDKGVDTGPIIAQEMIKIEEEDTLASLETKIHTLEHQLYPKVLAQLINQQQGENDQ